MSVYVMRRLFLKSYYSFVCSHADNFRFTGMWKIGTYYNDAKIKCADRRARKVLAVNNKNTLTFQSIYDYFTPDTE